MTTSDPGEGLDPEVALDWLRLQCVAALVPERVAEPLAAGIGPAVLLRRLGGARSERCAEPIDRSARRLSALGVRVLPRTDRAYPRLLGELRDPPPVLLVRGDVAALRRPCIAIVGARAATREARQVAHRLARDLSVAGWTIVSGLARGIDGAAHRAALEAGGPTIAVLGCGIDRVYPPEHRGLAERIVEGGAVASELPVGAPPRAAHFPLRNRLISGLSHAVIVVEARRRSGSLITVRHALDQGREVFVVPGAVAGPFAEGTNRLLREGARAVLSAADVLEDLGCGTEVAAPDGQDARASLPDPARGDGGPQGRVLRVLDRGPADRETLAERTGLEAGVLARALLELELAERIAEERDGRFQRCWT